MAKISLSSKKYNPKGYSTSTSKAMKESGAKYSTTDRSGNTNFYASGKDVDAGIAPIKKTDAQGNAITSDMLKPTPGLNLPPAPQTPNVGGMVTANNAGLANSAYNITTDGKGMLQVATPTTTDNKDTSGAGFDSIFKSYLAESQNIQPVSSADIYAKEYKQQKIAQKQQDVSNYASQLNTIVANRDANLLRVEGQGRGIPEVIIGGQQAQINKEAAIAALPVQAQLAAAQDNLALANQHLTTMVNLKTQDATNQYNYKTKLLDSVYQFATAQEQRRLDQLKVENDRAYQEKQDFIKTQNAALAQALGQGAPSSVYSAIAAATDTKSVITAAGAYNGDVLGRQIQQQQLANARLEGQKKLLDLTTPDTKELEARQKAQQRLDNRVADAEIVIDKVSEAKHLIGFTSTGFLGGLGSKVPGSKAYNLDKTVDTIKSKIGFEALQAMREASPTGGALGQVAVQELNMLQSTIASLDVGQDATQLRRNLADVETHYTNWLKTVGYVIAPDGKVIQITN
jgi:hypothetical protein